jgi:hypothetical protein
MAAAMVEHERQVALKAAEQRIVFPERPLAANPQVACIEELNFNAKDLEPRIQEIVERHGRGVLAAKAERQAPEVTPQ